VKEYAGINIQWPWAGLLISGKKTVETRSYPIPSKHLGKTLAIIETPGKRRISSEKKVGARIIGLIVFSDCFRYTSKKEWLKDYPRHQVPENDPNYGFDPLRQKWGWVVKEVSPLASPRNAPKKRGIVFCTRCFV
jgi:hypothetical protein